MAMATTIKTGEILGLFIGKITYVIKNCTKTIHITHYYGYLGFSSDLRLIAASKC